MYYPLSERCIVEFCSPADNLIYACISERQIIDGKMRDKPPALFGLGFCLSMPLGRNALIGCLATGSWFSGPNTESKSKRFP